MVKFKELDGKNNVLCLSGTTGSLQKIYLQPFIIKRNNYLLLRILL